MSGGADVNMRSKDGYPVLITAASQCDYDSVSVLLKAGADVNMTSFRDGTTALISCIRSEPVEESQKNCVDLLIHQGASVNLANLYGKTALMTAIAAMNELVVKTLIKAGANLYMADVNGKTSLMMAVALKNEPILNELIKAGADVNTTYFGGKTTSIEAARETDINRVKLLLKV